MDQERLVSCLHSLLCKETFPHFFSSYPPSTVVNTLPTLPAHGSDGSPSPRFLSSTQIL